MISTYDGQIPEPNCGWKELADETICPQQPTPLYALGARYDDFPQLTDDIVKRILAERN